MGVAATIVGNVDRDDAGFELAVSSGVSFFREDITDDGLPPVVSNSMIIDCQRAIGLTAHLNLRTIGVEPDENGRLWCDENLQTWGRGIYGIGDVVGFSTRCGSSVNDQANSILMHLRDDRAVALKRVRSVPEARPISGRGILAVGSLTR
jgi:hypothetical protein